MADLKIQKGSSHVQLSIYDSPATEKERLHDSGVTLHKHDGSVLTSRFGMVFRTAGGKN